MTADVTLLISALLVAVWAVYCGPMVVRDVRALARLRRRRAASHTARVSVRLAQPRLAGVVKVRTEHGQRLAHKEIR